MVPVRLFSKDGLAAFRNWLQSRPTGSCPEELLFDEANTTILAHATIDPQLQFPRQFEFAKYLNEALAHYNYAELMAEQYDTLWAWLSALYYQQLAGKKPKRQEHYLVVRSGSVGSLAYRNDARTAYLLYAVHGNDSLLCLDKKMDVWGDLAEQLTARQNIFFSKAYFRAACALYIRNGRIKRGIATKPKPPATRPAGDRSGRGGARRLAIALNRLQLTYDVEMMSGEEVVAVLPREFLR